MTNAAIIKATNSATTQLHGRAAAAFSQSLVLRNWMVGAWIVECEQTGKDRARLGQLIPYTLSAKSPTPKRIPYALSTESAPRIRGTLSRECPEPLESAPLLRLFWSKLQELIRIDDPWKRAFFESDRAHFESRRPPRQSIKRLPKRTQGGS